VIERYSEKIREEGKTGEEGEEWESGWKNGNGGGK